MELKLVDYNNYSFLDKKHEYNDFGGTGENLSPHLCWHNAPEDTQSFALTVFDPDAPTGSGFWHWIAFDIPVAHCDLPVGSGTVNQSNIPEMKQALSDFGQRGYGGVCPPEGDKPHRYIFTLHALKCPNLGIDPDMPNAIIRFMIHSVTLVSASVTVLYQR